MQQRTFLAISNVLLDNVGLLHQSLPQTQPAEAKAIH